MTTLLLVPAGETDLQVVIRHAGEERRTTVAETRVLHKSLLNGEDWGVDEQAVQIREFEARGEIGPDIRDCLRDADGRIRLVPAKLKYVLDRLERVDAAVIFSTQRDPEIFRSEPAAAGPVLAGWIEARNRGDITLARELALQRREPWDPAHSKWPGGAQWVNLLQGRERLEGSDPVQRPLAKELVRRLHLALARLQEDLRPSHVIIARTGGFPALKELIVQVANLIFGSERVEIMEVPQYSNHLVRYGAYLQKSPQEAYRLREAALAGIRKGDLEGAASFAERVLGDEWEQHWAEPVIAAADWLAGRSPVPASAPKYLARLNVPLRCFWAAARAEVALRAGRIQEAVINSVTFWDAALLDAIQRANWVRSLNEIERQLETRPGHEPPDVLLGPPESRAPLTPVQGRSDWYRYYTQREHIERWLDVLDEPVKTELRVMQQALDDRRPAIRNYRNAAVHGRLVGDDLLRAETEFRAAGVWSNNQPPRFLYNGGPAVRVLHALGVSDPLSIVEGMFKGLEKEILLPPGGGGVSS